MKPNCLCGSEEDILDVELNIIENGKIIHKLRGWLCRKCFTIQKETNAFEPQLNIGIGFIDNDKQRNNE